MAQVDLSSLAADIDKQYAAVKEQVETLKGQLSKLEADLERLQNAKDALAGKGTRKDASVGGKKGRIRRTEEQVIDILRDAKARGLKPAEIAKEQGVTRITVYNWQGEYGKKAGLGKK